MYNNYYVFVMSSEFGLTFGLDTSFVSLFLNDDNDYNNNTE